MERSPLIVGAAESAFSWIGKVSGAGGAVKGILGHIPGFAGGVTGFAGGLAIVGENGPELVRLPAGSDVIPNHRSAAGRLASSARRRRRNQSLRDVRGADHRR
jgi:hypothetical protein